MKSPHKILGSSNFLFKPLNIPSKVSILIHPLDEPGGMYALLKLNFFVPVYISILRILSLQGSLNSLISLKTVLKLVATNTPNYLGPTSAFASSIRSKL